MEVDRRDEALPTYPNETAQLEDPNIAHNTCYVPHMAFYWHRDIATEPAPSGCLLLSEAFPMRSRWSMHAGRWQVSACSDKGLHGICEES